ncbi:MAG: amidohydrolase [Spirochaetes bacterium]|nr:amidohydrolase [Spirochaetota bacterium]
MLITNTSVFDFEDLTLKENVHIVIEGGKIARLITEDTDPAAFKEITDRPGRLPAEGYKEIINGRDKLTVPGLANCHSHTAMSLLRGSAEDINSFDWFNKHIWLYEKNLKPEDVYWGTLLGAAEMLLGGVTFVCDHYFYMDQAFKAYTDAGIRADLGWTVFGQGDNREKEYMSALDFTEKYRDKSETITVSLAPHSPYICPEDFLKDIALHADRENLKLHIHVSEEQWQVDKSLKETGKTPVEYLSDLGIIRKDSILAHAYYSTDKDLKIIREKNALVAHAPKTYMKFGFLKDFLPRAVNAGIRVSFASDGPASNSNFSIFEAARDAALLSKLASGNAEAGRIRDIMPMLSSGYSLLNKGKTGKVKEGYTADLVLIDRNSTGMNPEINIAANLLYSLSDRDIDTVIVNGLPVVKKGELINIDIQEVRKNVNRIKNRMTAADESEPMQVFGT